LKLTAADLLGFNVIDKIIPEDDKIFSNIKEWLTDAFSASRQLPGGTLAANRYERFRRIGVPD
jgi:acetyl-CoA carboxylase alpha subunit